VRVEEDHPIGLAENQGWDPRIEVVQVGDLVRSHLVFRQRFTLVYDTLLGPLSGAWLRQRDLDRAPDKPLLVVVSHSDWDHCWGTQCFPEPSMALALCCDRIAGEFGERELRQKRSEHSSFEAVERVAPSIRLAGEAELDGGDLRLQLLHTKGHRPDHLVVYIPEIATLLAGDQSEEPFALLDSGDHFDDMISSLKRLSALKVDWLLCNHAAPRRGTSLLQENLEYYERLLEVASRSRSLEELIAALPYSGSAFYEKEHLRFLTAAWERTALKDAASR